MRTVFLVTLVFCELPLDGQVLKTTDISPDQSDYVFSGQIAPGGRIKSMVIDPNHDNILYAATEFAGIWKTTTGFASESDANNRAKTPLKWFQSSNGLRSGLTVNHYSLAVDAANSSRLLYATGDDDGRPLNAAGVHAFGGLWISTDSATNWSHVKLCTPVTEDGVTAVAFSAGRPFVETSCGIWTNATATLDAKSWTALSGVPFGSGALLTAAFPQTLLACLGSNVYLSTNLGAKWSTMAIPTGCEALTAVPNGSSAPYQVAVVRPSGKVKEVTIVDFNATATKDLGFSAVSSAGSGLPVVATVQNPAIPLLVPIPGDTYDLYAADGLNWFEYTTATPHFVQLPSNVHVDTWAMAIPSWYFPTKGLCAGYVANDGGIFFGLGQSGANLLGGGCAGKSWTPVMTGLHSLYGNTMTGISAGALAYAKSSLPLAIYMPTGDNDVFVMNVANCSSGSIGSCTFSAAKWQSAGDGMGDAGQALVDPSFPGQVLLSRNLCYNALSNPPSAGGTFTNMLPFPCLNPPPAFQFDNGGQGVGTFDLTQILTTPGELASAPADADYLAVLDFAPPPSCSATSVDQVVRNTSNPPTAAAWSDISPSDHFLACDIFKVQAGGGHGTGLNVYVLTTNSGNAHFNNGRGPGLIYRGTITSGGSLIGAWNSASGSGATALANADNFFVNPFDPSELYAVDVKDQVIKVSKDYGSTWNTNSSLTDLATNLGEYRIGCNGGRGGWQQSDPFTDTCSISWIGFDVFHPHIRVAATAYGGILFSRDDGADWIALDVTNNNHFLSNNLTEMVSGVFFDGETPLPGLGSGNQMIYAALKGHSLKRVDGPFLSLEALEFVYTPTVSPVKSIVVNVSTLGASINLRKDADGSYRGQALFDSKSFKTLNYSLTVDGVLISSQVYTLTATDTANGVAKPPL